MSMEKLADDVIGLVRGVIAEELGIGIDEVGRSSISEEKFSNLDDIVVYMKGVGYEIK